MIGLDEGIAWSSVSLEERARRRAHKKRQRMRRQEEKRRGLPR